MTKQEILDTIELRQSTLTTWSACALMYKFRHIDKLEPAFRYPGTIHGSALHLVLSWLHAGQWKGDLRALYTKALNYYLYASDESHIPVRWKRDMVKEIEALKVNAVEILENYRSKAYNKEALVLFSEVPFRVKMPRGYRFTGTIDQVRKNPDGTIELLDFKSSKQRPNRYAIPNDLQLSLYVDAIKRGELLVDGMWVKPNMLVDFAGIYFLRAHEVYKRKVPGKEIGQEKSSPFMRTTKTIQDLRVFRTEIRHQLSAMVKPWYYPNTASCAFCTYSTHCISRNDNLPEKQANQAQELLAQLNMA
ncbi:MAG: PD-(D/E)XK nuclease family protein [Candidatus Marinimicrobia bacterium]|nr:PD-(D/E)XK nuclease family protein [Candidatus Neomarinimicrobiota bacterium]